MYFKKKVSALHHYISSEIFFMKQPASLSNNSTFTKTDTGTGIKRVLVATKPLVYGI